MCAEIVLSIRKGELKFYDKYASAVSSADDGELAPEPQSLLELTHGGPAKF